MSTEAITFPNLNYGTDINVGDGAFTAQMLCAALGLGDRVESLGVAVRVGAIAAPDHKPSDNPTTWLWKPDTVQAYMTGAAAATVRAAIAAAS